MDDETWEQVQDVESGRGGIVSSSSWQQNQNQSEGVVIVDAHRKSSGGSGHKYYVPQHLLQNPKWIASCSDPFMYEPDIHLPDVDESTGHVLVHYLYTGAYQTLDNMKTSSAKEVTIEFKRVFLVYAMAKTYELAGLQQLAMHEMKHHSIKMKVFNVFKTLSKDFSKLQAKDD